MAFPKHVDDRMETIKLLSDVYPNIPKACDCLVFERTTWAILKKEKNRKRALEWLDEE